jgi:hypothetical protein
MGISRWWVLSAASRRSMNYFVDAATLRISCMADLPQILGV